MKKIYNKISSLELLQKTKQAIFHFSKTEWKIFLILLLTLIISTVWLLVNLNNAFMVSVPKRGGEISEGIIGSPRFINPVLANTDQDKDLSMLVYSGLTRKDGEGNIIPDLALNYTISNDGLKYTFYLKNDIYFHDGEEVTADDIIFTINKVKDPLVRSPKKSAWDGVKVEKIDNKTVVFNLVEPFASFIDNTTVGILPHYLFDENPMELSPLNENPIGSGPYKVTKLKKNNSGVASYYELKSFSDFALGEPYIKKITLKFYNNENEIIQALLKGDIDNASSVSAENANKLKEKNYKIETTVLPRIFALFFNHNQNQIFTDKSVLRAIDMAIDKDKIVKEVLLGYGIAIDDPILPDNFSYQTLEQKKVIDHEESLKKAKEILIKNGWTLNDSGYLNKTITENNKKVNKILEFSISTSNAPELKKAGELIKADLESIGMKVEIKTFDIGNLNQIVIRPRKYDALLFGQIVKNEGDLFAFWHSSQRNDPGLNIAMYTNSKVDKILEDAFKTINDKDRLKKYAQFGEEIKKDIPAVFIYSPNFIYAVSKELEGFDTRNIVNTEERFSQVYSWRVQTEKVWKIFAKNY